jgi:hypothetical protein
MANEVFANGREIACKAADGKSICAFPDVCFTPPQTPATPPGVPIPYPNTALAKDTTKGSKTVRISNQEVMLKNKSHFKKSTGDEAGCAPKKGIVTSKITGKVYFTSWSPDVKVEGKNVVRHLDLTTHNHGSEPANAPPWLYKDTTAFGNPTVCKEDTERMQKACKNTTYKEVGKTKRQHHLCEGEDGKKCAEAMECILVPKNKDKELCCSPNNTGDHLIEDHWVRPNKILREDFKYLEKKTGGAYHGAPTMCVNRSRFSGKHGIAHAARGVREDEFNGAEFPLGEAKKMALEAHKCANPDSKCTPGCIEAQLNDFYGGQENDNKKCKASTGKQKLDAKLKKQAEVSRKNSQQE